MKYERIQGDINVVLHLEVMIICYVEAKCGCIFP